MFSVCIERTSAIKWIKNLLFLYLNQKEKSQMKRHTKYSPGYGQVFHRVQYWLEYL